MKTSALFAVLMVASAATVGFAGKPIAKAKIGYAPWQAAWDAHARSEQARLHAIDRQRQANDLMTWYGTAAPGYYRSAPVVAYGRGQRAYERRLSRSPYAVPFPASPGYAYPGGGKVVPVLPYLNPSPPPVEHPVGHRKAWTSANSYVYQPVYASDQAEQAEPAYAPAPAPAPAPIPVETIVTPPALPEAIPTPQPE